MYNLCPCLLDLLVMVVSDLPSLLRLPLFFLFRPESIMRPWWWRMHIVWSQSETARAGISRTLMQVAVIWRANYHQPVQRTVVCRYFFCKGKLMGKASTGQISSILWEPCMNLEARDGLSWLNHRKGRAPFTVICIVLFGWWLSKDILGKLFWLVLMQMSCPSSEWPICAQQKRTTIFSSNPNLVRVYRGKLHLSQYLYLHLVQFYPLRLVCIFLVDYNESFILES